MKCPSCGNEVPARPVCLKCGATLFGNATLPPSALGPVPVPLTIGQKLRLLVHCLPLLTFSLMVGGYLFLVSRSVLPSPPPLFWIFAGAVVLFTGYDALQSLRDLISGVALAQEDLLDSSNRSRSRQGRGTCFGRFQRLGKLRMVPKVYFQSSPGQRYRVIYSPASKTVWALESPDDRIRP